MLFARALAPVTSHETLHGLHPAITFPLAITDLVATLHVVMSSGINTRSYASAEEVVNVEDLLAVDELLRRGAPVQL